MLVRPSQSNLYFDYGIVQMVIGWIVVLGGAHVVFWMLHGLMT